MLLCCCTPCGVPLHAMLCSVSIASQQCPVLDMSRSVFIPVNFFDLLLSFLTAVEGRGSGVVPEVTRFDTQGCIS